ncbi:MAG: methyltransferase [Alphaproteobacteria bacterium]|nr:methyltransferase [Alphaproteobacteria bacterium]
MALPVSKSTILDLNQTTDDRILGGKLIIRQPAFGYRVAIDPIFLAASIPAKEEETILDVGTGVAAAALCLAFRQKNINIWGIDHQEHCIQLAKFNVANNQLHDKIDLILGDIVNPPPTLQSKLFDHVMANPPYFPNGATKPSPYSHKVISKIESTATLEDWVDFCWSKVKVGGTITFIQRTERLPEILNVVSNRAAEIIIFPLWPKINKASHRVIVQIYKGKTKPLKLTAGMVLHQENQNYSVPAEFILRHGHALILKEGLV